jgi:hypothetical protein
LNPFHSERKKERREKATMKKNEKQRERDSKKKYEIEQRKRETKIRNKKIK